MAAANAPDLGCTGAECLRGVLDFFLGSNLLFGIGSNKALVEADVRNVLDPLLVISEEDRTGSTEPRLLEEEVMIVLT